MPPSLSSSSLDTAPCVASPAGPHGGSARIPPATRRVSHASRPSAAESAARSWRPAGTALVFTATAARVMELVRLEPRASLRRQWDLIGLSFLGHLINGAGGGKHAVLISMRAGRLVLHHS